MHARDVTANLIEVGVKNLNDFEWIQQLRYYWDEELLSRVVNSEFKYGYEYLGNSGRLVITPLTDRLELGSTLGGGTALHLGTSVKILRGLHPITFVNKLFQFHPNPLQAI